MNLTALRMLLGDGAKYLALVVGLAFASTLVIQQGAIFLGFVEREGNSIDNVSQADIWVMHPSARYFEEHPAFDEINLPRVRGVDGVAWAVPYLVTSGSAKLPDGSLISVQIVGADRVTRVGLPTEVVGGTQELIEQPDAVFFDDLGIEIYQVVRAGDELEINDHRAVVAAKVTPRMTFTNFPMVYTTYDRALSFAPEGRHQLTFILAKVQDGHDHSAVARDIQNTTGLQARTKQDFRKMSEDFFIKYTGVAVNFGITVLLGTLVGVAVAAQTFYTFVLENTKFLATLKAMGLGRRALIQMVLLQAGFVGLVGWGIGAGAGAAFGLVLDPRSPIAYKLSAGLLGVSFGLMVMTVVLAAFVAVRRVLSIEPALVFR